MSANGNVYPTGVQRALSCGGLLSLVVTASLASQAVPERKWLAAPVLSRSITGDSRDELLVPGSLVATQKGELAVFDFGTMELRAFSRGGRALWRTGRKGAGPGEFRNAMDVKLRSNGDFVVLDMGNRRITTVSPGGQVRRTTPMPFSASRFVPLGDTTQFTLAPDDSAALWRSVDMQGRLTGSAAAPLWLAGYGTLARETFTSSLGDGAVIAFRWSDRLVVLNSAGAVRSAIHGIEPVSFPGTKAYPLKVGKFTGQSSRIDPNATPGALSVAASGAELLVLFAGATRFRGRIVDVYEAVTGRYKGSHLLPRAAVELVGLGGGAIATLRLEPVPGIDVWQLPIAKPRAAVTVGKARP